MWIPCGSALIHEKSALIGEPMAGQVHSFHPARRPKPVARARESATFARAVKLRVGYAE
jgi:hypothetical protein